MRKHLSTILKLAISIGGLIYAFSRVPLDELGAELATIHWGWALLGITLLAGGIVLRAFRWFVLVRGLNVPYPFLQLVKLYFVGSFFNTFLPTGFGGDVVRILEASRHIPRRIAAGTVIVDRMSGLLMLFIMGLFALPFRPDDFPDVLVYFVISVSTIGIIGGALMLEGRLLRRFGGWLPGPLSITDETRPLTKLLDTIQACGHRSIFQVLAVSTLFNFLLVGIWWIFGRALGLGVSYAYFLLVVPIMSIILIIPSIGGFGIRESLAPTLFAAAGILPAQAVALALVVSVAARVAGLIGGPIYAFSAIRDSVDSPAA